MNISSVESSLFKYLYENFELTQGIKIFESIYYVDFDAYDKWIVIDQLNEVTGSIPRANYYLHLSIKNGLMNQTVLLNKLTDDVTALINVGQRIHVYDSETAEEIGEMEVCETTLAPVLQHAGGGCFRSLGVGLVYAGDPSA